MINFNIDWTDDIIYPDVQYKWELTNPECMTLTLYAKNKNNDKMLTCEYTFDDTPRFAISDKEATLINGILGDMIWKVNC